ncbi:MAG: hypothetical protein Q8P60_14435, partial [Pseudorhodobacter sp.]|nr:hypothetical protein [Pseudorhodobacter sp.]
HRWQAGSHHKGYRRMSTLGFRVANLLPINAQTVDFAAIARRVQVPELAQSFETQLTAQPSSVQYQWQVVFEKIKLAVRLFHGALLWITPSIQMKQNWTGPHALKPPSTRSDHKTLEDQ